MEFSQTQLRTSILNWETCAMELKYSFIEILKIWWRLRIEGTAESEGLGKKRRASIMQIGTVTEYKEACLLGTVPPETCQYFSRS